MHKKTHNLIVCEDSFNFATIKCLTVQHFDKKQKILWKLILPFFLDQLFMLIVFSLQDESKTWEDDILDDRSATKEVFPFLSLLRWFLGAD